MDLLGSIMNSMDKPPSLSEKERDIMKKRKAEHEKRKEAEKLHFKRFKDDIEKKCQSHFADEKNTYLKFQPMDHIYRSIIHEIAESQGLISYAFGTDGVDRYIRIYRKENAPCEDELTVRRRGEPWNETSRQQLIESRKQEQLELEESSKRKRGKEEKFTPNSNYKDKYVHLIGQDAALEAAKKTETNKSYGFVPSENKKDQRSIEQAMNDIRAKKRQKLGQDPAQEANIPLQTSSTSTKTSHDTA